MPVVSPNQHCCHWLMAIRAAKYGDSMEHMGGVYGHWYWGHMRSPMNGCEDVGCYSRAIPRAPIAFVWEVVDPLEVPLCLRAWGIPIGSTSGGANLCWLTPQIAPTWRCHAAEGRVQNEGWSKDTCCPSPTCVACPQGKAAKV